MINILFIMLDLISGLITNTYFNLCFIIIISVHRKYKRFNYSIFVFFLGLIYDLTISGLPFMYSFLYLVIYFLAHGIRNLNIYTIYIISIVTFMFLNYLMLIPFSNVNFNILFLIKTLLINLFIFHIVYNFYKCIYINR